MAKTSGEQTEKFDTSKGIRQGDALSATIFNIALEYITRRVKNGTLRTRGGQLKAYADDIVIAAKRRDIMCSVLQEIAEEGRKIGLNINVNKTKILRIGKPIKKREVRVGEYIFTQYVTICNDECRDTEMSEKILAANRALYANKKLLKSNTLSRNTKVKMYKTLVRPIIIYAAETMSMTRRDEENIRRAERKILRTIMGPKKINKDEYRRRTNEELKEMYDDDVIKRIKIQRAKWYGHIMREGENSITNIITNWQPGGRRRRGRPRSNWLQEVTEDLANTGIGNIIEKVKDRKKWREICEKIQ
ncbi:reverse transcriptase (rna-dependent dna polymerase) [Holotrichia oblita]|uniref:Reverse transcriptase (Rna-dependent dna polymerase) n=1 Tax=Holotrichia oblita TaxID=644536 RepID=A0ACB9TXY1_HOLOL|nr:reverse transcriptase (rna-dependent dna polymerase) [Holotrichia oblita]